TIPSPEKERVHNANRVAVFFVDRRGVKLVENVPALGPDQPQAERCEDQNSRIGAKTKIDCQAATFFVGMRRQSANDIKNESELCAITPTPEHADHAGKRLASGIVPCNAISELRLVPRP